MKVIVRCANNRVTKADMEREIERLFQENKDLRVQAGHLHDELANAKASVEIQRGFREEMAEEIEALEKELAESQSESSQSLNAIVDIWKKAVEEKVKAEERAEEYRIALMESDCRVDELEKQLEWMRNKNEEWAAVAQDLHNTIDEMKAQKEADDKKCEEVCAACNERYEEVLAERNRLREEVARLTNERDTAVHENTEMMFDINELQDKWEAEHNLRVEAEKAYDKVASEAYDMHQQITNLTVDNTRLENKVEELEDEVDACRHNIDGYIEGNRRMRAEYEKKLEAEQDQTKHWHKKYDNLKENYDELVQLHREWGEEIDRLRKVIIDLQTNRFTTDEFIGMLVKNFMPSTDE
jgi:predicted  nucleic acid-binding Zn-ribbon protein